MAEKEKQELEFEETAESSAQVEEKSEKSEEIEVETADALLAVQKELKAPKGQFNSFGKYSYRSAEDILEAVKPLNAKYGILLTISDDLVEVGGRVYIKATAKATYDNKEVEVTAFAREPVSKKGMDDSQITGSTSSYARKYALNGLYLIDDNKDADTNELHEQQKNGPQQPKPQNSQREQLIQNIQTLARAYNSSPHQMQEMIAEYARQNNLSYLQASQIYLNGLNTNAQQ
ncbi:ERF family protein [Ligilactobacillus equi]